MIHLSIEQLKEILNSPSIKKLKMKNNPIFLNKFKPYHVKRKKRS